MIPPGHVAGERRSVPPGEFSHKERLLAGQPYDANDPELVDDRIACRKLLRQFNQELEYDDAEGRKQVLRQLLGGFDEGNPPWIEPPFFCDFGYMITVGKGFYANFNCVFLDCGPVKIGDNVLLGPAVQIYPVGHHVDPAERAGVEGLEFAKAVTIGDNVWIGGNAVLMPGVTIGEGSTVAAGAVVTRDVEPYVVVAGSPAKVIRRLARPVDGEAAAAAAAAAAAPPGSGQ
ncbi:maltose O-acetyltransferase [Micractinium conductrix]|uniref:Maltose O-acetyltransferase n=1 Tax=Micractinium conductrix TaxID=554055 RepID=A0A2P6UZH0_9CHLO|nr:maltose O-acetyltransferase [Micractinium conductrix]|eukprot:PSC67235.1 maltose O-acetyltransferase [Micractinium conductrix]